MQHFGKKITSCLSFSNSVLVLLCLEIEDWSYSVQKQYTGHTVFRNSVLVLLCLETVYGSCYV